MVTHKNFDQKIKELPETGSVLISSNEDLNRTFCIIVLEIRKGIEDHIVVAWVPKIERKMNYYLERIKDNFSVYCDS
jgi:hypothetical protein